MKRNIYFLSFADSSLKLTLHRIGKEAENFNLFKQTFLLTEKELPTDTYNQCQAIIERSGSKRGYGFWSWKPAIILDLLLKINEGDILFYCDAGSHLNCNGKRLLNKYIKHAIKQDIWAGQLSNQFNDYAYTKSDTILLFKDKITDPNILFTGQVQPGNIILKKNDYTIRLIKQWKQLMTIKNLHYFDDSPSFTPNHKSFIENRHDQSIFSLLIKTNHAYLEDAGTLWYPYELWTICRLPILNMRDKNNTYPIIEYIPPFRWIINRIRWEINKYKKTTAKCGCLNQ